MGRILVTGAAGFIGRHVLELLSARGAVIRAAVRSEAGLERLAALGWKTGNRLELVSLDLAQRFAVPKLLEGCDQVIHAAGRVSSRRAERRILYRDNVLATAHLLEAALAAGIRRFVYVSHVLSAGAAEGDTTADEDVQYTLTDFPSDFAQAARVAQLEALRCGTRGLPIVFPTPTFCLGPGDVNESSRFVLGAFRAGLPLAPAGGLNVVDVRDAAAGIVAALEKGVPGERYFLGGTDVRFRELFGKLEEASASAMPGRRLAGRLQAAVGRRLPLPDRLARLAGGLVERLTPAPPLDLAQAALFGRCWYYSDQRARSTLGYRSRPLEETLQAMVGEWVSSAQQA